MPSEDSNHEASLFSFGPMLKLGLFAGALFGTGYWYAKLTSPRAEIPKIEVLAPKDSKTKQTEFETKQQSLQLGYFKELFAQPRKTSIASDDTNDPKPPKVEEQKPSSDRLAKALERVLGQQTPNAVSHEAQGALPSTTGSAFAVQVASVPDRKAAEQFANRLIQKGYEARLVQAELPGLGRVFRVRIHGFETESDADEVRLSLATEENIDAITVAQ